MTVVNITIYGPSGSAAAGSLTWTPVATLGSPSLPAPQTVTLSGGSASLTVTPNDSTWVWQVSENLTGLQPLSLYVNVPNISSVSYAELVKTDPISGIDYAVVGRNDAAALAPSRQIIQIRRDTAANWTAANPVLAQGEEGWETDTGNIKIGDGSTAWTSLVYAFGYRVAPAPTGVAATDTANLQAVLNAVPAAGGQVTLHKGTYVLNAALTVSNPTKIVGAGKGDWIAASNTGGITVLSSSSATADGMTVNADGCTFSDFAIVNTASSPTAGAGIHVTKGDFTSIRNVMVNNFYDDIKFDDGFYYSITECSIQDAVRYGLNLANTAASESDNGDIIVANNVIGGFQIARVPTAAVYWEPAGGLKFTGNKINGTLSFITSPGAAIGTGILVRVPDGVSTSVCVITGNSIEAWNNAGIDIAQKGPSNTGTFGKIVITGNEIAGNNGTAVSVAPASSTNTFREVVINGNSIGNCSTGIQLGNVAGVYVGPNTYKSVTSTIVSLLTGVTGFKQVPQQAIGSNITLYNEASLDTGGQGPFDQASFDLQREIGNITSTTTVVLYKVAVPQYGGGTFSFSLAGNLNGVGAAVYTCTGVFSRGTGAVTVTANTAQTAGGTFSVTYDTASASGYIWFGVARGGTGTSLQGRAHLVVDGNVGQIVKV